MADHAPSGTRLAIVEALRSSGPLTAEGVNVALGFHRPSQLREVRCCLRVLRRLGIVSRSASKPATEYGRSCRTTALYSLTEQANA